MMKRSLLLIGSMLLAFQTGALRAEQQPQRPERLPSIDDYTNNTKKIDGYFPLYWDERTGSLFIEIPRLDTEFLFSIGLGGRASARTTSASIAAQGGGGRIVSFQRVGPRVLLVQPNQSFRSSSANPLERKSVEDSFAKSVLWGFTVAGRERTAACSSTPPISCCAT